MIDTYVEHRSWLRPVSQPHRRINKNLDRNPVMTSPDGWDQNKIRPDGKLEHLYGSVVTKDNGTMFGNIYYFGYIWNE